MNRKDVPFGNPVVLEFYKGIIDIHYSQLKDAAQDAWPWVRMGDRDALAQLKASWHPELFESVVGVLNVAIERLRFCRLAVNKHQGGQLAGILNGLDNPAFDLVLTSLITQPNREHQQTLIQSLPALDNKKPIPGETLTRFQYALLNLTQYLTATPAGKKQLDKIAQVILEMPRSKPLADALNQLTAVTKETPEQHAFFQELLPKWQTTIHSRENAPYFALLSKAKGFLGREDLSGFARWFGNIKGYAAGILTDMICDPLYLTHQERLQAAQAITNLEEDEFDPQNSIRLYWVERLVLQDPQNKDLLQAVLQQVKAMPSSPDVIEALTWQSVQDEARSTESARHFYETAIEYHANRLQSQA